MVGQSNQLKGGPSAPPVFDQRHGVGMNRPLERRLELWKFSLPMNEMQNGLCHYPLGINIYRKKFKLDR